MKVPRHVREKRAADIKWAGPIIEWNEKKEKLEQEESSPLHLVKKVKTVKGRPYWEKNIMKDIGLGKKVEVCTYFINIISQLFL